MVSKQHDGNIVKNLVLVIAESIKKGLALAYNWEPTVKFNGRFENLIWLSSNRRGNTR